VIKKETTTPVTMGRWPRLFHLIVFESERKNPNVENSATIGESNTRSDPQPPIEILGNPSALKEHGCSFAFVANP
jgi:hypothetical protein